MRIAAGMHTVMMLLACVKLLQELGKVPVILLKPASR